MRRGRAGWGRWLRLHGHGNAFIEQLISTGSTAGLIASVITEGNKLGKGARADQAIRKVSDVADLARLDRNLLDEMDVITLAERLRRAWQSLTPLA